MLGEFMTGVHGPAASTPPTKSLALSVPGGIEEANTDFI